MKLSCVAIDDEPLALDLIREYVSRIPELNLIKTFDDAIAGAEFLRANKIDLLFVDVNMPDITGLELVRSLSEMPMLIFTTAYGKFAVDGFELDAVDYLLKPISFERFSRAVTKAIDYGKYKNSGKEDKIEHLFVYSEYRMLKLALGDIEYIESLEDYIKIALVNAKPVMTLMPLKKVLEKLPADRFERIHRSYIVAVDKIKSIQGRKVMLTSSVELPVSDSYSDFLKKWKNQ